MRHREKVVAAMNAGYHKIKELSKEDFAQELLKTGKIKFVDDNSEFIRLRAENAALWKIVALCLK